MLRALALDNYSPYSSDNAAMDPKTPNRIVIMAESQRIQRESRRILREAAGLHPLVIASPTCAAVLRAGDAPPERPLDAPANFAAMATFTTRETAEPIPLELAESARTRRHGLLGRDGIEGALLLSPASAVHTLGMRFAIDVAYLDRKLRVLTVRTMHPGRVGLPRPRARYVLEAEAGALEKWGVRRKAVVVIHDW